MKDTVEHVVIECNGVVLGSSDNIDESSDMSESEGLPVVEELEED
jgi:hypothetical protein